MTSKGSYCVVFDTLIEDMPVDAYPDRDWGIGNNPKSAVQAYLEEISRTPQKWYDGTHLEFTVRGDIADKLLISVASSV